ncbi:Oxysterol-binding protein [Phaffia rhodozyma]|uniref:Oxysterol-binding protein n=1 Tax=Phaffia rhodozyma TaxID=264483 RepID=A0A0F7SVL9_PHARH|nr:Oxysterol-binding protein [Phaffia rhodozyma]
MPHLSSSSASKTAEEPSVVPAGQQAGWSSFIKQLANVSGDLSSMTAPPFILSPVSLTEFPAYWCERPDLFAAIADGRTAEDRSKLVLKWFICTLKGQYMSRNEKMGSEKKPLNPVLGELFFGSWPNLNNRGDTHLAVEQVSHHPPITAYYIENPQKGVSLVGASGQKTSFSFPSIVVKQNGHATLSVKLPDGQVEKYLIGLPKLRIDGLITGSPYIEITDSSFIQSSSGYSSLIHYSGKGYITGKAHTFKATMSDPKGHVLLTAEGQWDKTSKLAKSSEVFTDATVPKEEVSVVDLTYQGEYESRKLWSEVADGIRTGDFDRASRAKTQIEVSQRELRKTEQAQGTEWALRYFKHTASDPDYSHLATLGKVQPSTEEGWEFTGPLPTATGKTL